MKRAAFVLGLLFLSTTVLSAQRARTVDNFTLEKFKQQRLAAERDYRDNYERMGFPSPEELDRQRDTDMAARLELAQQLRTARLEKERLELEQRSLNLEAARFDAELEASRANGYSGGSYYGGFGYGGFGYGGFDRGHRGRYGNFPLLRNYPKNRLTPFFDAGAYRVTPFGVIQTPNPRPAIIIRGGRGRHR
jgi:hypothetical protein